jgi:hypothetical protein
MTMALLKVAFLFAVTAVAEQAKKSQPIRVGILGIGGGGCV